MMDQRKAEYTEFALRRIHSLTGLLPLTFFIFFHFFANAFSTVGEDAFNQTVTTLRGLPFLIAIEWVFLFIPFLIHMLLGLWIIYTSRPNPMKFKTRRNWAYFAQRGTGIVVFVFVLYHVITLHYIAGHRMEEEGKLNFYSHLRQELQRSEVYWWYVVGVAATTFHLANGICTFCMTWGFTVGRNSQRYLAYAMTGLGIAVFVLGFGALNGFIAQLKHNVTGQQVGILKAPAVVVSETAPPVASLAR